MKVVKMTMITQTESSPRTTKTRVKMVRWELKDWQSADDTNMVGTILNLS